MLPPCAELQPPEPPTAPEPSPSTDLATVPCDSFTFVLRRMIFRSRRAVFPFVLRLISASQMQSDELTPLLLYSQHVCHFDVRNASSTSTLTPHILSCTPLRGRGRHLLICRRKLGRRTAVTVEVESRTSTDDAKARQPTKLSKCSMTNTDHELLSSAARKHM